MSDRIISPLNKEIVHKICSGQVVVTLSSAIKELLENSIDAQATKIDIRLKDYGSEIIEVVDNGLGIPEEQFEEITKKHCTSKLRNFEDLATVATFGFRGEALSSLCQLSEVSIHTCSANAAHGTRLQFDANGSITSKRPLARAMGTTVTISRLFHNLPVRRKHLTDPTQLAKEFSKAVNMLTAYCLATVNVQITCTRTGKSGEKVLVVSNGAATSVRDNIAAVFGQNQLNSLIPLAREVTIPNEVLEEFSIKPSSNLENIQLHGYISKPPGVQGTGDVSTSGSRGGTAHHHGRSSSDRQYIYVNDRPCDLPKITRLATDLWRRCSREALSLTSSGLKMPVQSTCSQHPVLVFQFQVPSATVDVNLTPDKRTLLLHNEKYVLALTKAVLLQTLYESSGMDLVSLSHKQLDLNLSSTLIVDPRIGSDSTQPSSTRKRNSLNEQSTLPFKKAFTESWSNSTDSSSPFTTVDKSVVNNCVESFADDTLNSTLAEEDMDDSLVLDSTQSLLEPRPSVPVYFSLSDLKRRWSAVSRHPSSACVDSTTSDAQFSLGQFRAEDTTTVEGELTTYFSKSSFDELEVVGQFNLGFIVARHKQDLFIIDQHASDEKYRFEQLCDNHRFISQPLVLPQPLELSVGQEQVLLSNLDVFAQSGFAFHVDESAPCGKQVQLTATPMVENKVFGRPDVEEMLFVLAESCSRRCRPSRLRDILASRACRSAVMIGTALDHGKMRRILRNMGTLEHPWNCPHGRPTMRHLFHLGQLGLGN